jgi:hypothetical protein
VRSETKDGFLDDIRELMEGIQKQISLTNLRLCERFLQYEIHFIVHFRLKDTGELWGVCFECPGPDQEETRGTVPGCVEKRILGQREKESVLVDVVQLMEPPENLASPAFVWFDEIERFYDLWPDALYLSTFFGFISIPVLRDGKFYLTARLLPNSNDDQLVCKVIQGASEVVNDVPGNSEHVEGKDRHQLTIWSALRQLRIVIEDRHVSVVAPVSKQFPLEVTQVMLGPFNLYPKKDQSIIGGKCHRRQS